MANFRQGNTYHIDTQYAASEELALKDVRVSHIIVTATAATSSLVLSDAGLGIKLTWKMADDNTSQLIDLSANPIRFSTSIRPTTLTDCNATCVLIPPGT